MRYFFLTLYTSASHCKHEHTMCFLHAWYTHITTLLVQYKTILVSTGKYVCVSLVQTFCSSICNADPMRCVPLHRSACMVQCLSKKSEDSIDAHWAHRLSSTNFYSSIAFIDHFLLIDSFYIYCRWSCTSKTHSVGSSQVKVYSKLFSLMISEQYRSHTCNEEDSTPNLFTTQTLILFLTPTIGLPAV